MFDPNALSSRLRDQRSRKKCPDKHIFKLPSIKLCGIKFQGIRLHGARLLSISDLSRDLFLPIRMANPRLTNQGTI
jgi:hypothetical protein